MGFIDKAKSRPRVCESAESLHLRPGEGRDGLRWPKEKRKELAGFLGVQGRNGGIWYTKAR